ncbi:MAG TPA: PEGA domain-containing protein [Polyangia bacterium]
MNRNSRQHRFGSSPILAAGFFLFMRAGVAAAEPPPSPAPPSAATPEARTQAKKDLASGQRLVKRGQFDEALAKLRASYAADPSGAALMGMGEADRQLDRPGDAYRDYQRALSDPAGDLQPADREAAQRALTELAALTGTVKVALSETGASCAVDGRPLGIDEIGRPLRLSPGRHVLEASKPGFEAFTFPVWVTAGKELATTLTLKPAGGASTGVLPVAPPPARVPVPLRSSPPSSTPTPPPPPAQVAPLPSSVLTSPPPPPPTAPTSPPPPPATSPPPGPVAPPSAAAPPLAPPPTTAPGPLPSSPALVPAPTPVPPPAEIPPPIVTPISPPASELAPLPSASQPPLPTFEPTPTPPPSSSNAETVRLGFLVGILTFPRPIEAEVMVKLGTSLALGLKGGYLPELSTPGGTAKLDLKAIEGTLRWFPGEGVFFLGAGFGYQNLQSSISEPVDYSELTITADMSGFFVSPQLGVLWVSQSGFAISFSLGVQIPIPKDPVVTSTYGGQPVPMQATSTVPQDVIDQARSSEDDVRSVARFIVKYPFPNIDLLRIGFFF